MRITDSYLQNTFLSSLGYAKKTLVNLQTQVATGTKIQKASENPLSAARINRLQNQLQNISTYSKNIENGQSFLAATTTALDGMQTETQSIVDNLTYATNAANSSLLPSYGQKIKQSLQAIVQYANTQVDGKYAFGGTNSGTAPYSQDATWFGGGTDTSGSHSIKISSTTEQKINTTGEELFGSVVKQSGSLDRSAAIGTVSQNTTQIQNADGTVYNVAATYTKTGANAYSFQYEVKDAAGTVVSTATKQLAFDATTGKLQSVDGATPQKIAVEAKTAKISFTIDAADITEGNTASVSGSASQPTNMLNAIQAIVDDLNSGKLPSDAQLKLLNDFNARLLQKSSDAGSIQNRLTAASDMLQSQQLQVQDLLSSEKDTDKAKAAIELQAAQYTTEMLYKTSAMILPKSLIDYL